MKAIFAIRPNYVRLIFSGCKTVEFRKSQCRTTIDTILIYATSPISAVVGEVSVEKVVSGSIQELLPVALQHGCLTKEEFDNYYHGRNKAVAYFLCNPLEYKKIMPLLELGIQRAPQSFCYLSKYDKENCSIRNAPSEL